MGLWQGMEGGQVLVARAAGVPPVTGKLISQGLLWGGMSLRIPSVFSPLKAVCVSSRSAFRAPQATLRSSSAARFWQGPAPTTRGDPSLLHEDSLRDLADLPRGLPLLDELSALEDRPGSSGGSSSFSHSNGSSRSKNGTPHRSSDGSESRLSGEAYTHGGMRDAASREFQGGGEIHSAGGDGRAAEERLLSDARAERSPWKEGKKAVKQPNKSTRSTGMRVVELGAKELGREASPPAVDLHATPSRESSSADVPALSPPQAEPSTTIQLERQHPQTQPVPRSELPPRSLWPRGNFTSSGNSLMVSSMSEVPCPDCSGRGYQRCPCTSFNSPESAASGACSQCSGMKRIPCSCCRGRRVILATLQDLTSLMRQPVLRANAGNSASPAHRRARSLARKDLMVETMVEKEMQKRKGQTQQPVGRSLVRQVQEGAESGGESDEEGVSSGRLSEGLIGDAGEGDVGRDRDSEYSTALDSAVKTGVLQQRGSRAGAKRGRKRPLTAEDQEKMTAAKREMREVFSMLARRRFADPEVRERSMAAMRKGYTEKNAPQLISAGLKAYYASEENRRKKSELMTGRVFRCKGCGKEGHRQNFCPALGYVKRSRAARKGQQVLEGQGGEVGQVDSKRGDARTKAGPATAEAADDGVPAVHLQGTTPAPPDAGPGVGEAADGMPTQRVHRTSPTQERAGPAARAKSPARPAREPKIVRSTTSPVQAARLRRGSLVPFMLRTMSEPEGEGSAAAAGEDAARRGKRCCGACGKVGHNRRTCQANHSRVSGDSSVQSSAAETPSRAATATASALSQRVPALALAA